MTSFGKMYSIEPSLGIFDETSAFRYKSTKSDMIEGSSWTTPDLISRALEASKRHDSKVLDVNFFEK